MVLKDIFKPRQAFSKDYFKPKGATYTLQDAAKILSIDIGTLRDWIARNYIEPYIPSESRGKANLLNYYNLLEIKLFEHLLSCGLSRESASSISRRVHLLENQEEYLEHGENPDELGKELLLITGPSVGQSNYDFTIIWFNEKDIGKEIKNARVHLASESKAFSLSDYHISFIINWKRIVEAVNAAIRVHIPGKE